MAAKATIGLSRLRPSGPGPVREVMAALASDPAGPVGEHSKGIFQGSIRSRVCGQDIAHGLDLCRVSAKVEIGSIPKLLPVNDLRRLRRNEGAQEGADQLSMSALAMMRSLTPGARWKRRFSVLIVDVPATYQRNLLRDCHLTGTSSAFILSSASLMEDIDPILIPDPEFQGPVAQSTPPSISSARPSPHSTRPPTLPTSPAAPHMRSGPLAG